MVKRTINKKEYFLLLLMAPRYSTICTNQLFILSIFFINFLPVGYPSVSQRIRHALLHRIISYRQT